VGGPGLRPGPPSAAATAPPFPSHPLEVVLMNSTRWGFTLVELVILIVILWDHPSRN